MGPLLCMKRTPYNYFEREIANCTDLGPPAPWSHPRPSDPPPPCALADRISICGLFRYVLATLKLLVNISTVSV